MRELRASRGEACDPPAPRGNSITYSYHFVLGALPPCRPHRGSYQGPHAFQTVAAIEDTVGAEHHHVIFSGREAQHVTFYCTINNSGPESASAPQLPYEKRPALSFNSTVKTNLRLSKRARHLFHSIPVTNDLEFRLFLLVHPCPSSPVPESVSPPRPASPAPLRPPPARYVRSHPPPASSIIPDVCPAVP